MNVGSAEGPGNPVSLIKLLYVVATSCQTSNDFLSPLCTCTTMSYSVLFLLPLPIIGTSCHSYPNLCPGHYFTEVRATSVHCPRISSTYEKNVFVGPSLEISRAGMDIDCNRGEYALESNIPSMWRCRVNSDSWHSCEYCIVLYNLIYSE